MLDTPRHFVTLTLAAPTLSVPAMNAVTRRPWVFPVVCLFHFAIGWAMENQWAHRPPTPTRPERALQIELFTMPAPSVAKARPLAAVAASTPKPAQTPARPARQTHSDIGQTHPEITPRQPTTAPKTLTHTSSETSTAADHPATEATPTHAATRMGGQGSASVPDRQTPIALHSNPPPVYPALSREAGETGRVLLRAEVSAEGRVQQLEIQDSSGFRRLDQAALNAVRHWRFQPATTNGQPIAGVALIPLRFTLDQ